MKIYALKPATLPQTSQVQQARGNRGSQRVADSHGLSTAAGHISAMSAEVATMPEVRADVVAEARAAIQDGSLDSPENRSALVESLLMEL